MTQTAVNWREQCKDKLMSPAEAVATIKPGDRIWAGVLNSVPTTLCGALAERAPELPGAAVFTALTAFNWDRPEILQTMRVVTLYAGPLERKAVQAGRFDYIPAAGFRSGRIPNGLDIDYEAAIIPISPPDEDGYCSYGAAVFFGPWIVDHAQLLIGEVHPEFIRTGGQNSVHVSRFHRLAEATGAPPPVPIPPRSEETIAAAEVICTLTATDLVTDRTTLQIGVGDVSAAMCLYLTDKHDLGIHTELLPGGVTDLVKAGIVTGRYKEVHPGKVVASVAAQLGPEELAYIDGNPDFELYEFGHTDDMQFLLQFSDFTAINNALFVDVTGNVCSESWGHQVFTGPGGQPTFTYAASVVSAKSIIVLPSSQLVDGVRHPRIVARLAEGSTITTHRSFVDYVVTEQGIAHLSGKPIRERAAELISVAHPDFRAEMRREVAALYNFNV
ncbi:MAG: acetyl-CoA hydrolase/transferase family protein [Tepidiformaceae bacterium]